VSGANRVHRTPDVPPPPRRPRRLRWGITLGLLGLLLVLIVLLPRSRATSRTLPPGRWGRTIACLERNQTYRVLDRRTGGLPDAATRAVALRSTIHRYPLAELRDAGSPTAARAIARRHGLHQPSLADYRTAGPIVWVYTEDGEPPHVSADAGDRTIIAFCVRTPPRPRAGRQDDGSP
jgi:hypothetical protein